jgi:DNA primase catalytic subunit
MRYASLDERQQFYSKEFDTQKVTEWFGNRLTHTKFAVIMGRHTRIVLPQYQDDADTTIIIDDYNDMSDVQAQIIDFLPEAVYYDRNLYDQKGENLGQELAFDLDPENVTCPIHGTLTDKMARKQGLSFCELELNIVQKKAIELYEYLERKFSDLAITYSGRGFHVHVLDKGVYLLTSEERLSLAREVKEQGFPIDEWVTSGEYRLIRLPYSLNGLVSRIVIPLKKSELEGFNPITDSRCLPKFLGQP